MSFGRVYDKKKENKVIYIFTEGEVTEPTYFNLIKDELKLTTVNVEIVGTGFNTVSLIDHILEIQKKRGIVVDSSEDSDEIWAVFDKDQRDKLFNNAIKKAVSNNIHVAYSNECFELWFLLHFDYNYSALTAKDYCKKLSAKLDLHTKNAFKKYDKQDSITRILHTIILPMQARAIRHSKKLLQSHGTSVEHSRRNPSTTVHLLVETLNGLRR